MFFTQFTYFITGFLVCTLGALPFGLVNLTVMDVSIQQGNQKAMKIAHGAALVEVLFGLTALLAGGFLQKYIEGNIIVHYIIILVLAIAGLSFFGKKQNGELSPGQNGGGFLKGIFLNLISLQVLLFWLFAVTYLTSRDLLPEKVFSVIMFGLGVWIGKITILAIYMIMSKKILSKSLMVSKYMNQIIGSILFVTAAIQIVKI